ncbi:hypothetical protein [Kitasatospora sp. NPDC127116]|uniref:hypothetical protein n=1 Tax=Kitasatospora sp. NPDC127116 TaxID=3345367 RepID=UPI00362E8A84
MKAFDVAAADGLVILRPAAFVVVPATEWVKQVQPSTELGAPPLERCGSGSRVRHFEVVGVELGDQALARLDLFRGERACSGAGARSTRVFTGPSVHSTASVGSNRVPRRSVGQS